jgi:hypothetical protein
MHMSISTQKVARSIVEEMEQLRLRIEHRAKDLPPEPEHFS